MGAGSSFGQDALISDAPRNATVTTARFAGSCDYRSDFSELLMSIIEYVTLEEVEAVKSMQNNTCLCRCALQSRITALEISDPVKRIPLPMLRDEIKAFERILSILLSGLSDPNCRGRRLSFE